jgi:hypothetical protein
MYLIIYHDILTIQAQDVIKSHNEMPFIWHLSSFKLSVLMTHDNWRWLLFLIDLHNSALRSHHSSSFTWWSKEPLDKKLGQLSEIIFYDWGPSDYIEAILSGLFWPRDSFDLLVEGILWCHLSPWNLIRQ